MYNDIEKMLEEGMTPEKIYQEALRITEAKNAATAKIKKEKIAKARGELLTAIGNYTTAVSGKEVDKKFMEDTAKILIKIEDDAVAGPKKKSTKEDCRCKKEPTDDEKLISFLKMIGAWL